MIDPRIEIIGVLAIELIKYFNRAGVVTGRFANLAECKCEFRLIWISFERAFQATGSGLEAPCRILE